MDKPHPDAYDCDLLCARVVLIVGALLFALLLTIARTPALAQDVEVIRPQVEGPASKPKPEVHTPTKSGQTEATVAIPEELVGEPVMSLEGETLGDVAKVQVNENGLLVSIDAELGGFFGIGSKIIRFSTEDFAVNNLGVVLAMTADEVQALTD